MNLPLSHRQIAFVFSVLFFSMQSTSAADLLRNEHRPNILIIMADDLGFSDLGCYGSEIETPNLDRLAGNGLRLSQFYNTAKCHSSRVSLLTGQYCIAAGDVGLGHAVTSAEVLRESGYATAMTGKWHLKQEPTDFGFEQYFGHLSGACNYFKGDKTFRLNGQPWEVPAEGFYTTVANVDYGLKFLNQFRQTSTSQTSTSQTEQPNQKPWYLYVAFNAPHAPLHALPQDYEKYQGRYEAGWDAIRRARVASLKQKGIIQDSATESPRPDHVPAWDQLEPWRQKYEANRMTTLAAMIDRMDREIGRLVDDLKSNGELDNTMILFVSDNGACPYDRQKPRLDAVPTDGNVALADSTGWSWARNTPFRYYKQNQFEGGIASPAIFHWPNGLKTKPGTIVDDPAHLTDIMPTLAEISESEIPTQWPGRELRPVTGVSLTSLFNGQSLDDRPPIHLLFSKDRGLRDGDWKLVSFRGKAWELYNITNDRSELNNLAESNPERVKQMAEQWTKMCKEVLHAKPTSYAPVSESGPPHRHPEWTNFQSGIDSSTSRRTKKRGNASRGIRARKNTSLKIVDSELQMKFTGEDPGLAMDLRPRKLPTGPYRLRFRLQANGQNHGDIFFTNDSKTSLPNGTKVTFVVAEGSQWQDHDIRLDTKESLQQIRVDIGDGPGKATLDNLRLCNDDGDVLIKWPENSN